MNVAVIHTHKIPSLFCCETRGHRVESAHVGTFVRGLGNRGNGASSGTDPLPVRKHVSFWVLVTEADRVNAHGRSCAGGHGTTVCGCTISVRFWGSICQLVSYPNSGMRIIIIRTEATLGTKRSTSIEMTGTNFGQHNLTVALIIMLDSPITTV